ncbi:MAG: penicillin-binding transpeptidase domain-containing protein [Clostridiales bacterium]|nr:penicillin-binding transpeptidase domain-containing protein [Clostridiales bacterium]
MKPSLNNIKRKVFPMVFAVLVALAVIAGRLVYWQIIRGEELSQRAKNQQTGSSMISAQRGKIYDRNGKTLAESASVDTLVCNPQDIKANKNSAFVAKKLSPIIDMDVDKIEELLTKDSSYQVIKKRISVEESEEIRALMTVEEDEEPPEKEMSFGGIYFEDDSKRYYPFGIAPHILGFTGYDNNGLQGIELTFDSELSGKAGEITIKQNAKGQTLEEQQAEYLSAAKQGADVVLTIDETIQHFLEKYLEEAIHEYELKEGAAGIVMNPKTGEVLAMSTKPDFDSNNPYDIDLFNEFEMQFDFSKKSDDPEATPAPTEDPDNLSDEKIGALRNKMWRNKAVSDSYEPGSTFKIITAAAALEEHVVNENDSFYCPGFKVVADRKIKCASSAGHGAETFEQGVMNSCNPVFIELGQRLGAQRFMEYFTAFGLTEKTGIELVGEGSSIYYKNGMSEVDLATSSFGQGFQVTPIQLITAISAVINGGERMRPQIVKEIRNGNGILKSYAPEALNRVISEETSQMMREILEKVVSDPDATGKNAYVKGCRIGGKTGTSEKGNRNEFKRIASFVGFAPANDPEIVCLVMLDEPQIDNKYGGTLAAPLVGSLIEDVLNYLGVEKQYGEDEDPIIKTEIPDVRDMSVSEARSAVSEAGLQYILKGSGDTIVKQLPNPGMMLDEKSMIILYTDDTEPEKVKVPDLVGMNVVNARETLNMLGLNFEVAGAGHSEFYNAYSIKQSVPVGEKVEPGTVIGVEFRQNASD